jgi:hypothetical protein
MNYSKAKRIIGIEQQNNPDSVKNMAIPKTEEDFFDMMSLYRRFKNEGYPLDFHSSVLNSSFKYLCKAQPDTNFKLQKVKFLVMKKIIGRNFNSKSVVASFRNLE